MQTLHFNGPGAPRLEQFITKEIPGLAPGMLHKYLRQNKIKLNGKKQPLSTRLAPGDEVRLFLPAAPAGALQVLYEDDGLLAVYKPAGLATNREDGDAPGTLTALATAYAAGRYQPQLCHRLDTGTSGVVLFAKTQAMHNFIVGLMQNQQLTKLYTCVTFGRPQPAAATLQGWHTKNAQKGIVHIGPAPKKGAKPVQTRYTTLAHNGPLALLQVQLITGRTHQIRAHMASVGTPILGDSKYGNQTANRRYKCRYQCLCATEIHFPAQVPPGYEAYAGLRITCEKPWYHQKMLDGAME